MFDKKIEQIIDDLFGGIRNLKEIVEEKDKEIKYINSVNELFRHEISNHQTVIACYIHLLEEPHSEQERLDILKKMFTSSEKMINLTKGWSNYQTVDCQMQWQTLSEIFKNCNNLHPNIKINIIKNNILIISTPAIKMIISSMVNNTAMHGGETANEVKIDWQKTSTGIAVIYEDNGVGIPDSQKSLIFKKGFGKHTGIGLFLVKMILNIIGYEITEKGTYGKGARFEINVPEGSYKLY